MTPLALPRFRPAAAVVAALLCLSSAIADPLACSLTDYHPEPGLTLGIFSGGLRFTHYRGTSLLRVEAIAKTDRNMVAYKYDAGLRGFSTERLLRVRWVDLPAMRTKHFSIAFNATGQKWVRFAVWDSAVNAAFVQPVWLE